MSDDVAAVSDGETLLRTDFAPQHVVEGKLIAAGIRSDDLTTRGFSIDREHLVDVATIEKRAEGQMAKDPQGRQNPYIAPFLCGPVRAHVLDEDKKTAFLIQHEPINDNAAHAALYSAETRPRSLIKALKNALLPYLNEGICTLERYKADKES